MRISDWSSDVCSSDLGPFRQHRKCPPAPHAVPRSELRSSCPYPRFCCERRGSPLGGSGRVKRSRRICAATAKRRWGSRFSWRRTTLARENGRRFARKMVGPRRLLRRPDPPYTLGGTEQTFTLRRSEEQTSELQSLMRTTY